MKTPLMKYQCNYVDCFREFITVVVAKEIEESMVCPFCECGVSAVAGGDPDAQELYEDMGCLYPGGGLLDD